jgi:NAD-specific glutamate dehydrogenase
MTKAKKAVISATTELTVTQMSKEITSAIREAFPQLKGKVGVKRLQNVISCVFNNKTVSAAAKKRIRDDIITEAHHIAQAEIQAKERRVENAIYQANRERDEAKRELQKLKDTVDDRVELGEAVRKVLRAFHEERGVAQGGAFMCGPLPGRRY